MLRVGRCLVDHGESCDCNFDRYMALKFGRHLAPDGTESYKFHLRCAGLPTHSSIRICLLKHDLTCHCGRGIDAVRKFVLIGQEYSFENEMGIIYQG